MAFFNPAYIDMGCHEGGGIKGGVRKTIKIQFGRISNGEGRAWFIRKDYFFK
jgi:hypothetical protein